MTSPQILKIKELNVKIRQEELKVKRAILCFANTIERTC